MKSCIVVVPVYKVVPKVTELASLRQCLKVLKSFDLCLLTYEELDLTVYMRIAEEYSKNVSVKYFGRHFFTSVEGYNRLCYNIDFYSAFRDYDYMLIYQLDAWVFRDELQMWCEKGYDYIGSPFFKDISPKGITPMYSKEMLGVGNGGFSLRRIQYCIKLLERWKWLPYLTPSYLWKMYLTEQVNANCGKVYLLCLSLCKIILKSLGYRNTLNYFIKSGVLNEDIYFSKWAVQAWKVRANLPSCEEASFFSFEVNPSYLYDLNGKLPFGCHAFEKWEFDTFWSKYIQVNV
ncbi:DUF5672 family protein [uncultured Bacteroides sp.]|uniref:DUF5672 family protein n=1 Tax=uncultured Bacteroides sp. TaxID=162156 RepID=UPI0025F8B833|nr:DUF5672 family protein [uncultured Bacteroides sp.]